MSIKKELKTIKLCFWIVFVCFLILVGLFGLFVYENVFYKTYSHPKISYNGLNEKEIRNINLVLEQVKPFYFYSAKSITFYKDIGDPTIAGQNSHKHIKVEYIDNSTEFQIRLCHELIHDFSLNEEFVRDIDNSGACYG